MAAAAVQQPQSVPGFDRALQQDPQVDTSANAATSKPRNVEAILNFYQDPEDGGPPHPAYVDRPETYFRAADPHTVTINDVTGKETEYTLDKQGFQIHRHEATVKDFLDDDEIKASYYAETEQLLKDVTGASRIFIFDHTIRRNLPSDDPRNRNIRGPAQRVHIDQSYVGGASRVPHHLPDEAAELQKGRVQIINVWRPIKTILRDALTVADARTVAEEDLVPTPLISPTRSGETFQVRYNPAHRWYYKSNLTPGEVLLIKCYDSKTDGRARRIPHTAFADPAADKDLPARESIEVRALVFHPDDRD